MKFGGLQDKVDAVIYWLLWFGVFFFISIVGGCYWGTMASYNESPVYTERPQVKEPPEMTNELGNRFVKVGTDRAETVHRWRYVPADRVCVNQKAKDIVGGKRAYDWDGVEVIINPEDGSKVPLYRECK